ncbi:MAG: ammonium transporter [Myxococcales bacterium]|nr:ammonium transporter [Myxococcales bacterium]
MSAISSGDTAWLLISTALVMLMTPGLALFYGGMVQGKNVLSTFMHSFFALGLVSVQWALIGYTLAFGPTHGGLIGGLDFAGLDGVGTDGAGRTVPHLLFMMYQGMFAVITPALISGAYAERLKFSAYVLFTLAWTTLVYDPIAHWVWGPGGWLGARGALDFAGGTVVHWASGVSALVAALVLGKRIGYPSRAHTPHNLTLTVLGAGLLWFGWFGFNAGGAMTGGADGSAAAPGTAALALVNTHLAAAAGALAWAALEAMRQKKATMLGVASGLVAGLVGITPAAGFVGPGAAMVIGALTGGACFAGVLLKHRFGYDDSLDAFGVHGVGGAVGAILTGVFATAALTPAAVGGGALAGNLGLVGEQLLGLAAAGAYAAIVTLVLLKLIDKTVGLRVEPEVEYEGLDGALHGETGYAFGGGGGSHPALDGD